VNLYNNVFVFVVCGNDEHISTLNFSLNYLKKFCLNKIIIVTDLSRNNIEIQHDTIINHKTPDTYNHHQASIWLKTSLNRILPEGPLYCYLDSDVIALNKECSNVFNYYKAPITFANDHCNVPQFSPYALNCGCIENFENEKTKFEKAINSIINHPNYPPDYENNEIRTLFSFLESIANAPIKNIVKLIKLFLSLTLKIKINLTKDIAIDPKQKSWLINDFIFPSVFLYRRQIKKNTGYNYSFFKKTWIMPNKEPLPINKCSHLTEAIKNDLNINITNSNWQHWNGGVFLFNSQSHSFMDYWHKLTIKIFENKYWKTRDQGTLIASVWQFKLQNHNTLPEEYNFIADFYKPINYLYTKEYITAITPKKIITPRFIHVYHHFGNKKWDLWNIIESILTEK